MPLLPVNAQNLVVRPQQYLDRLPGSRFGSLEVEKSRLGYCKKVRKSERTRAETNYPSVVRVTWGRAQLIRPTHHALRVAWHGAEEEGAGGAREAIAIARFFSRVVF